MLGFLFSPFGRVSRLEMWVKFFLPLLVLNMIASILDTALAAGGLPLAPFGSLLSLFYFWPGFAVPIKRFHDRGMTGWWVVIFLVLSLVTVFLIIFGAMSAVGAERLMELMAAAETDPTATTELGNAVLSSMIAKVGLAGVVTIGIVQFVILFVLAGERGDNRFGPDPRDR